MSETTSPELRSRLEALLTEWDGAAEAYRYDGYEYETPEQEADDQVCETYEQCATQLRKAMSTDAGSAAILLVSAPGLLLVLVFLAHLAGAYAGSLS